MNEVLPEGWERKKLGDLATLEYGKSPKKILDINGKYPIIGTGGVVGRSSSYLCDGNTTIIGRKGTINTPIFVSNKFWAIDTTYYTVNYKNTFPKWFFYYLQRINLKKYNEASGVPSLNRNTLYSILFLSPPLSEQKKIASILSSIDEVIEKTTAQVVKLKDLKTSLMQELLTKGIGHSEFKDSPVGRIPVEWEVVSLGKKATIIPGYAFSSNNFVSKGVPLIRMGNLYQNQLNLSRAPKYMPRDFIEKHSKFAIYENDIVFSMTGTAGKEDYGFAVKIPKNTPTCLLNQRVAKVISNKYVSTDFILHLMHSRFFLDEIYAIGAGTKQANLSTTNILSVNLPFPPLKEQKEIAKILTSVDQKITTTNQKLSALTHTKKALMQDLLTGKKRVM